jgi:hypothetical protein
MSWEDVAASMPFLHPGDEPGARRERFARAATLHPRPSPTSPEVPRISEFYGIVIEMYYGDHAPPHFHARYGGDSARVAIASGEVIAGSLPGRAVRLVREWVEEHRAELETNWERAVRHERPEPIDPLR